MSQHQAIALYQQLAGEGTGTASSDLKEIASAAYYHIKELILCLYL